MKYQISEHFHYLIYVIAMRWLNLADLIAMVEKKLIDATPADHAIAIADLAYIIYKDKQHERR